MITWYLVPRTSPQKKGPKYEAIPCLALYSGLISSGEVLATRYLAYQVSIVRLAHVHAVLPRPVSQCVLPSQLQVTPLIIFIIKGVIINAHIFLTFMVEAYGDITLVHVHD